MSVTKTCDKTGAHNSAQLPRADTPKTSQEPHLPNFTGSKLFRSVQKYKRSQMAASRKTAPERTDDMGAARIRRADPQQYLNTRDDKHDYCQCSFERDFPVHQAEGSVMESPLTQSVTHVLPKIGPQRRKAARPPSIPRPSSDHRVNL